MNEILVQNLEANLKNMEKCIDSMKSISNNNHIFSNKILIDGIYFIHLFVSMTVKLYIHIYLTQKAVYNSDTFSQKYKFYIRKRYKYLNIFFQNLKH